MFYTLAEGQRNVTVIGTVNSFSFPSTSVKVDVISTSGIILFACVLKAIESIDRNSLSTNEKQAKTHLNQHDLVGLYVFLIVILII